MAALAVGAPDSHAADVSIRRRVGAGPPLEVRVAIIGNVDSGKSTMVRSIGGERGLGGGKGGMEWKVGKRMQGSSWCLCGVWGVGCGINYYLQATFLNLVLV